MQGQQAPNSYPCDQCRSRKIRCNYCSPCDRCQTRSLACTFHLIRKKPGRKSGSGRVLQQLQREDSPNNGKRSGTAPPTDPTQVIPPDISEMVSEAHDILSPCAPLCDTFLPTAAPRPPDPQLSDPERISQSNMTAAWISDIPVSDINSPNDSFYTFDDFAQSLLNSSTAVHANHNRLNEAVWSPMDHSGDPVGPTSHIPHPVVQPSPPHTISTNIATESEPSRDVSAFEASDTIVRSVDLFFRHLYPTYPILIERQIRAWLSHSPSPKQSETCMLWALCAATLVHVDSWPDLTFEQRTRMARSYITLCLQTRLNGKSLESPSFADVVSSLLVAITYFELRFRTTSWVYVREAVTLAMASGLHNAATNMSLNYQERVQQQRCYALLFVTERGASILDNFPISIMSTPSLSDSVLPDEDPTILLGLQRLCDLFSLLDSNFIRLWNDHPPGSDQNYCYTEFANLQEHLRQPIDLYGVSDIQRADILVTQQWLRLVFWQAELRLGLITTTSADPAFAYDFPMEIASSLCDVVKSIPPVAIQVHGLGIFKKQFEIAYSLLDALTLSDSHGTNTYYETLRYLLFSLSASPSSHQIYVKTLQKKIGAEQKYRSVSDVQLFRVHGPRRS